MPFSAPSWGGGPWKMDVTRRNDPGIAASSGSLRPSQSIFNRLTPRDEGANGIECFKQNQWLSGRALCTRSTTREMGSGVDAEEKRRMAALPGKRMSRPKNGTESSSDKGNKSYLSSRGRPCTTGARRHAQPTPLPSPGPARRQVGGIKPLRGLAYSPAPPWAAPGGPSGRRAAAACRRRRGSGAGAETPR
jgi:hypothetical protein